QHIGKPTGHAGTEVVAGLAEYADHAAGHVFAAVIPRTLDHRMATGVAHRKPLAGHPGGEQLAPRGAIEAGVADDGGLLGAEGAARGRRDHQLAAGHALAHVIVRIPFQVHVQATGVPDAETLARGTTEAEGDGRAAHALVAVDAGDFTGHPRPDRAVAVGQAQLELAAGRPFD